MWYRWEYLLGCVLTVSQRQQSYDITLLIAFATPLKLEHDIKVCKWFASSYNLRPTHLSVYGLYAIAKSKKATLMDRDI
jgi:hypothetical protein